MNIITLQELSQVIP